MHGSHRNIGVYMSKRDIMTQVARRIWFCFVFLLLQKFPTYSKEKNTLFSFSRLVFWSHLRHKLVTTLYMFNNERQENPKWRQCTLFQTTVNYCMHRNLEFTCLGNQVRSADSTSPNVVMASSEHNLILIKERITCCSHGDVLLGTRS